jgi:hypothetical protein
MDWATNNMLLRSIVFALALLSACAFARAQSFTQPGINVTINGNSSPLTSAPISISSSGNNVVVAGQTGKIIRVYRMAMVAMSAVTATIQDGGSTALTGPMVLAANQELVFNYDTQPWFISSAGNAFEIKLSSGVQTSGVVYFTTN